LRGKPVDVLADDHAVVTMNLAVRNAVDAEVRAEQPACLLENAPRVGQWTDRVVEAEEKCLTGRGSAQPLFDARSLSGGPRAVGD
jgi:hypothetical protein